MDASPASTPGGAAREKARAFPPGRPDGTASPHARRRAGLVAGARGR
jgi:hypothetical protein